MKRLDVAGSDALSSVLREINVRSVVYCLSDFTAPWGFRVERSPVAKFHVLLHGTAVLTVGDAEPVKLSAGDLVVLPHGDAHAIADQPGSSVRQLDAILAEHPVDESGRLSYGGNGSRGNGGGSNGSGGNGRNGGDASRSRLLCGGFELSPGLPDEFAEFLPAVLTIDSGAGLVRWLEPLFALLREETQASAPGAAAIFAKLADVFVTQALRSYLAAADGLARLAWPAVPDPDIAGILRMMRARPEARWSIDAMAQRAGMSRTSFNARFRAVVGQPPMTYLTELRLRRGAGYLSATTKNVREVAHMVGYDNEASFSKAFSRIFGRPPGAYRRELLAAPRSPAP